MYHKTKYILHNFLILFIFLLSVRDRRQEGRVIEGTVDLKYS